MQTPSEFKRVRLERREKRKARAQRLSKWVPILNTLCQKYGISCKDIDGGHQFRVREYIVNWWPSSNKITVQYVGTGENRKFDADAIPGEPKILTAIKKLIRVVKNEVID